MIRANVEKLVAPLKRYVKENILAEQSVSDRGAQLEAAAAFISDRLASDNSADLVFICTHNSRRSHLAQVWAAVSAHCLDLKRVRAFSGGIEVTACNQRTIAALQRAGFNVEAALDNNELNPRYQIQFAAETPAMVCYSKIYLEEGNPRSDFAAMMCCSDVDEKCPLIEGAAIRVPLHYDDPKSADGTLEETIRYDERCLQIGRDMFRMMSLVSGNSAGVRDN